MFNSRGELTAAADGIIAGWLRKEKSHFFAAKTCKPVWRLMYDDVALGEEDLDEHEVLKAISLMSKELPACIAAQQAKPTSSSSCNDKCNRPSSGLSLGGSERRTGGGAPQQHAHDAAAADASATAAQSRCGSASSSAADAGQGYVSDPQEWPASGGAAAEGGGVEAGGGGG